LPLPGAGGVSHVSSLDDSSIAVSNTAMNARPNRPSTGSVNLQLDPTNYQQQVPPNSVPVGFGANSNQPNDSESVSDTISTCSRSPHPSFSSTGGGRNSSGFLNMRPSTASASSTIYGAASQDDTNTAPFSFQQERTSQYSDPTNIAMMQNATLAFMKSNISVPVPSLRCDRYGSLSWQCFNTLLYDFEALKTSTNNTSFYLVDELKLKSFITEIVVQQQQRSPNGGNYANFNPDDIFNNGVFSLKLLPEQAFGISSLEKVRCCLLSMNKAD
jgi:hypothetical protein